MRRTRERRRPKAHPAGGRQDGTNRESCYRCRHGRGLIECACRYARRATSDSDRRGPGVRVAYAGRLAAGLVLLAGRRFGPGLALVAARGFLPKLTPALAALPALVKSAWAWIAGVSLAGLTAVTVGSAPAPAARDAPGLEASCVHAAGSPEDACAQDPSRPAPVARASWQVGGRSRMLAPGERTDR